MGNSYLVGIGCVVAFFLVGSNGEPAVSFVRRDEKSFNFTIQLWDLNSYIRLGGAAKFGFQHARFHFGIHNARYVDLVADFQQYSAGRASFYEPITFWKPTSKKNKYDYYSFSTSFTFIIQGASAGQKGIDDHKPGDGFTFFIDSSNGQNVPANYGGELLGLYSNASSIAGKSRISFLAVEFDTVKNGDCKDINDNHVALDIHSVVSTITTDLYPYKINLTSGDEISVLIEYDAARSVLNVYMSNGQNVVKMKSTHVLTAPLNLKRLLKSGTGYVGFSGGTGSRVQRTAILAWEYRSWITQN